VSAPTTADEWADRYGELKVSGARAANAWLGIPLAVGSLIGMLWSAPVPDILSASSPVINFGSLFLMASFVYYCILSIPLALGGLLFLLAVALPSSWLTQAGLPLWPIASAIFAPALAWQLIETRRATGRLLLLRNLQYLMLGPIWLLRAAYRRVGLPY
jgi:hypothetical protein